MIQTRSNLTIDRLVGGYRGASQGDRGPIPRNLCGTSAPVPTYVPQLAPDHRPYS
jgi:hypothetical protein